MAIKKVVIARSRTYNNYEDAKSFIDICISKICRDHTIIIVSGGCSGADKIGGGCAVENGFTLE